MKQYNFRWLSHLGYMEDADTGDEAHFPSGTAFCLASDAANLEADAVRFRWLMEHHGEAIRNAIAPDKPGDVIHFSPP
jgi:hypothetical protein